MLPVQIEEVSKEFRKLPGVGIRGSQKIALDILQLNNDDFSQFISSLNSMKKSVVFCTNCGFFAEAGKTLEQKNNSTNIANSAGQTMCNICLDSNRIKNQICLVEKPTDIITLEKSQSFRGYYHVLEKLISPLDNIFPQDTKLNDLLERRIPSVLESLGGVETPSPIFASGVIELIVFFKQGFSADATVAYLMERLKQTGLDKKVKITKLAQGLPMYFNTETLDSETLSRAIQDRREVVG